MARSLRTPSLADRPRRSEATHSFLFSVNQPKFKNDYIIRCNRTRGYFGAATCSQNWLLAERAGIGITRNRYIWAVGSVYLQDQFPPHQPHESQPGLVWRDDRSHGRKLGVVVAGNCGHCFALRGHRVMSEITKYTFLLRFYDLIIRRTNTYTQKNTSSY